MRDRQVVRFSVETADECMDLYTPVTLDYAKSKNKFTGKINLNPRFELSLKLTEPLFQTVARLLRGIASVLIAVAGERHANPTA